MLDQFFQIGPIAANAIYGTYDGYLVLLSYIVAFFASYIALDLAGRLRDENNTKTSILFWLFGGAFSMGAGIWSMHFIGMLAFQMPVPMGYNPLWTALSMAVAILASLIALSLLIGQSVRRIRLMIGGFFLGLAIAAMHYTGMHAMTDTMKIRYVPSTFFVSVLIAIVAAEAALWLAIKSNQGVALRDRIRLKIMSALVMGAAICGMHYTGMAAAIFFPKEGVIYVHHAINHNMLAMSIAGVTFLILGVSFLLSTYKEISNQQLIATARLAGMAEVSSSVLHSVGNVLNSLNVSTISIGERIEKAKISQLNDLSELIQENKNNLAQFLTEDQRGLHISDFLLALSDYWITERREIIFEVHSILKNIQHIKSIISTQQSLKNFSNYSEIVDIQLIIEEAITVSGISLLTDLIKVNKEFDAVEPCLVDKVKLLQILVNLLRNAKDALIVSKNEEKIIFIKLTLLDENTIALKVTDNGVGVSPENLTQLFIYGFSTKSSGHGFGLHSSVIQAKQMGGSLNVESAGVNEGATFTLLLPYKLSNKKSHQN